MKKKKVGIIGGGASGIISAIYAAENGAEVTILEGNDKIGKKILVTGNGKCNLSNTKMNIDCFHSQEMDFVSSALAEFGVEDTIFFFENLGLLLKNKNGYLYPLSEQAAVVLDVLRIALEELKVKIITNIKIDNIYKNKYSKFVVLEQGHKYEFDSIIICTGSKAASKTGSDGSGYRIVEQLGHSIIPIVPALVQLRCSDTFCKSLAGIRMEGRVDIVLDTKVIRSEEGEIQLTDYGISGIPVFQLSGFVNKQLLKGKKLKAVLDFLPYISEKEISKLCKERILRHANITVEEFFTGILNKKFMMVVMKECKLELKKQIKNIPYEYLERALIKCKFFEFHITGSNPFEQAQVCSGGINLKEISNKMESKILPGLYFAGEILDVDGICGGYNLQWAWTSGAIAGKNAALDISKIEWRNND